MTKRSSETANGITPTAKNTRRRGGTPLIIAGSVLVAVVLMMALVSVVWTPQSPTATNAVNRLASPSAEHWLGTDGLGRDIASMLLVGSRVPLLVGLGTVGVGFAIGVPLGILAAMTDRGAGTWVMRGNDILQAFPALLLAIVLAAIFGPSTVTAVIALGLGLAPGVARVARSGTLQVLSREYALAARAAGRGPLFLAIRHVLPNIRGILIVQATVGFAIAILAEAALSYLGLGTPPPAASWGRMLQDGQAVLHNAPLTILWPGLAVAVSVLGFNLLGDGLRDRFDPRMEVSR
ncbi:ABC transporter permease [Nesterenkonia alkaliphila]|uniref:ABC transporter permease subunit n=1 Tax=Nesterenkonia alkaliphila TaxID=1463631 RepID=A0A7K1UGF4_9MICC|nr:ABC transporter permease [Nesterenkonia alkaliphila]MVT25547.1 ABC transporter permease subunit [Nesterenkonia alkaliphila]GFZ90985.1 peptide ABC transporter permease [Nesterenkonia alkaliphila]